MEETIINVNTLPDILCRQFPSEKVKVKKTGGVISLIPIGRELTDEEIDAIIPPLEPDPQNRTQRILDSVARSRTGEGEGFFTAAESIEYLRGAVNK